MRISSIEPSSVNRLFHLAKKIFNEEKFNVFYEKVILKS